MDSEQEVIDDGRLIYTTILPLKDLVSTIIAVELCHRCVPNRESRLVRFSYDSHDLSNILIYKYDGNVESLNTYAVQSVLRLPLPLTLQDTLKERIRVVLKKVKSWASYNFENKILQTINYSDFLRYFCKIAWKSDGDINYQETASRILSDPAIRINEFERFSIMSIYCLEEEIGKSPPPLLETKYELTRVRNKPLLNYWYHVMVGETNLRPPRVDDISSGQNIHSILYFWYLSSPDERIHVAFLLIQKYGVKYQSDLLSRMDESQQNEIFMKIGQNIIVNFVNEGRYFQFAQSTWLKIINMIAEGQFVDMVVYILKRGRGSKFEKFLTVMWKSIPDRFKQLCLDIENGKIFNLLIDFENHQVDTRNGFLFLLEILPDVNADSRVNVLRRITSEAEKVRFVVFEHLITRYHQPWLIDRLLKLCSSNANEQSKLRKKWVRVSIIEDYCSELFVKCEWDIFDNVVRLYLPDVTSVAEFKARLALSSQRIQHHFFSNIFTYNLSKDFDPLNKIIDHVFPEATAAANFRKDLFLSDHVMMKLHPWLLTGRIHEIKDCIEEFLSSAKHMIKIVKEGIIWSYRGTKLYDHFFYLSDNAWQSITQWCFGDDAESLMRYKQSLPLHSTFCELLACAVDERTYPYKAVNFTAVNTFLNWYLGSPEEVRKFKIQQIFQFSEVSCVNEMFNENIHATHDNNKRKDTLAWFFYNDPDQVPRFKSVYAGHRIVEFIDFDRPLIPLYPFL